MGWRIAIVVAAMAACLAGTAARAETRLALVIGNSNYTTVNKLPNPVNDARSVADDLKTAGFDVTVTLDVTQVDMRRAIQNFAAKVAKKGPDTIALVYYAGHGVQVDGENFLVPVDARIERESDIAIASVRLADLMSALAAVPSKMRIVILDACRNNPFATTKQTRGLAIVDAPSGSIVAYSTAPGTEATDGAGGHSPYTAAFIEVSKEPHLQIEQLFKQVRLKVNQATNGQQTPWESSSLTANFWFMPSDEPAPPPNVAVASTAPNAQQARLTRPVAPTAPQAPQAPTQPPQVTTATVPQDDNNRDDNNAPPPPSYAGGPQPNYAPASTYAPGPQPYYAPQPQPNYAAGPPPATPVAAMQGLSADDAYDMVVEDDVVPEYEQFLALYPSDPRAEWVRTTLALRVDAMAWRYATVVNTPAAYAAYSARYPGGAYVDMATRLQVRPRLRPIDVVIAPRVIAPPPFVRIALPMLQMRRATGTSIVRPMVFSRPGRFERANRLAPTNQRLNPTIFHANTNPGPTFHRQNAVNVPGPTNNLNNNGPHFHQPGPGQMQGQPNVHGNIPQFRGPQQRVQIGPKLKPPPAKCEGRGCRR
jgi:caspase domain-containing protein